MTFLSLQQPRQVGEAYRVGTVGLLPPRVFAQPGLSCFLIPALAQDLVRVPDI
jgi:hypothetical protein